MMCHAMVIGVPHGVSVGMRRGVGGHQSPHASLAVVIDGVCGPRAMTYGMRKGVSPALVQFRREASGVLDGEVYCLDCLDQALPLAACEAMATQRHRERTFSAFENMDLRLDRGDANLLG